MTDKTTKMSQISLVKRITLPKWKLKLYRRGPRNFNFLSLPDELILLVMEAILSSGDLSTFASLIRACPPLGNFVVHIVDMQRLSWENTPKKRYTMPISNTFNIDAETELLQKYLQHNPAPIRLFTFTNTFAAKTMQCLNDSPRCLYARFLNRNSFVFLQQPGKRKYLQGHDTLRCHTERVGGSLFVLDFVKSLSEWSLACWERPSFSVSGDEKWLKGKISYRYGTAAYNSTVSYMMTLSGYSKLQVSELDLVNVFGVGALSLRIVVPDCCSGESRRKESSKGCTPRTFRLPLAREIGSLTVEYPGGKVPLVYFKSIGFMPRTQLLDFSRLALVNTNWSFANTEGKPCHHAKAARCGSSAWQRESNERGEFRGSISACNILYKGLPDQIVHNTSFQCMRNFCWMRQAAVCHCEWKWACPHDMGILDHKVISANNMIKLTIFSVVEAADVKGEHRLKTSFISPRLHALDLISLDGSEGVWDIPMILDHSMPAYLRNVSLLRHYTARGKAQEVEWKHITPVAPTVMHLVIHGFVPVICMSPSPSVFPLLKSLTIDISELPAHPDGASMTTCQRVCLDARTFPLLAKLTVLMSKSAMFSQLSSTPLELELPETCLSIEVSVHILAVRKAFMTVGRLPKEELVVPRTYHLHGGGEDERLCCWEYSFGAFFPVRMETCKDIFADLETGWSYVNL